MDPMKLKNSILGDLESDGLTSKAIADAARQGDHLAQEVFDFTGKILGRALADVVALLNPQRIVITGGVVQAGDLLLTDRKSTRLNSSHVAISYAVFCLKKKIDDRSEHVRNSDE